MPGDVLVTSESTGGWVHELMTDWLWLSDRILICLIKPCFIICVQQPPTETFRQEPTGKHTLRPIKTTKDMSTKSYCPVRLTTADHAVHAKRSGTCRWELFRWLCFCGRFSTGFLDVEDNWSRIQRVTSAVHWGRKEKQGTEVELCAGWTDRHQVSVVTSGWV